VLVILSNVLVSLSHCRKNSVGSLGPRTSTTSVGIATPVATRSNQSSRRQDRIGTAEKAKQELENASWDEIRAIREILNISQADLASDMSVEQPTVSYYERTDATPDGGQVSLGREAIRDRLNEALSAAPEVNRLRSLVDNDVLWDRIESIESIAPNSEWVYDLEVAGTHVLSLEQLRLSQLRDAPVHPKHRPAIGVHLWEG